MGAVLWGALDEDEAVGLCHSLELVTGRVLRDAFDMLLDARLVDTFERGAFDVVSEYVVNRLETYHSRVRRVAMVVPPGVVGVMLAGVVGIHNPRFELRAFDDRGAAASWLGRHETVADRTLELGYGVHYLAPTLRSLREYFALGIAHVSLASAAAALGTTPRTLQRELQRMGTDFTTELTRARVRAAKNLLALPGEKIATIARDVGLSVSQLHSTFRRDVGKTPSEYRACTAACTPACVDVPIRSAPSKRARRAWRSQRDRPVSPDR